MQAGRWSYLADDRDPIEVSAFEKATRNRVERMRALRWPSSPDEAATQTVRDRMEELLQEARAQTRSRSFTYQDVAGRHWTPPPSRRERIGEAVGIAMLVLILGMFVIGVIGGIATIVSWLRRFTSVQVARSRLIIWLATR